MKKILTAFLLFCVFTISGFTTSFSANNKLENVRQQDPEDPTATETSTPTDTATATETPTETSTSTATETPTETQTPIIVQYPTATPTETKSYERPLIYIRDYDYDESDTYAGGDFSIKTIFQNLGQKDAYNVVITYSSNDIAPTSYGGINLISTLEKGERSAKTQYFTVADDIDYSPATIDVDVDYKDEDGNSYSQSLTLSVVISGYGPYHTATPEGRPQIVVIDYDTDTDPLQAGSSFLLSMNLQNRGLLNAYNVDMTIGGDSDDSSDTFLPIGTSNIQVIGNVVTQQIVKVKQTFVVSSDAEPGVYPITLTFTYRDEDGNEFTDSQIVSLMVYLVPSIEISFYEDPGTFNVGEESTLPIQVVNIGSDDVLLGDILIEVEDATLSNYWTFVGTLESGGSFTMDTDITPSQAGTYPVTITVDYQDNFNNAQVVTETIEITVEGQGFGGGGQGGEMGEQATPDQTDDQQRGGGAGQGNESFWDMLLRFIRGMIGFDSSTTTNSRMGGNPMMN